MQRIPEPELMLDEEQARAYAEADFSEPHGEFIRLLLERLGQLPETGAALDLGCGPGDISFRFAAARPGWRVDALDGSPAMLALGRADVRCQTNEGRVLFHEALLPLDTTSRAHLHAPYDLVFSNSLLHHLPDPAILWDSVGLGGHPHTRVFVMDLMRPSDEGMARDMVDQYASGEPEILRRDFYHSLRAAYRLGEVREQLASAGLAHLRDAAVSDRHFIVWGSVGNDTPS
ncbi:class I SAM-dependent methyltransferase [Myxococcota bacterium]|nr:class I SAM-dependent methyltransferase [Myxococcota bacterium]